MTAAVQRVARALRPAPGTPDPRWLTPALAGSVIALGIAASSWVEAESGFHLWLGLALVLSVLPLFPIAARIAPGRVDPETVTTLVLAAGVILGCAQLATVPGLLPGGLALGAWDLRAAPWALCAAGLAALSRHPVVGRAGGVATIALFVLIGATLIAATPFPRMDVFDFHREAALRVLAGGNPYAMTFPANYPDPRWYGPGVIENGRIIFGFPYPPLVFAFTVPAQALLGDIRYGCLAAVTIAAIALSIARPGPAARGAVALLVTTPFLFFVIQLAWVEPIVLFALAAVVLSALRAPRLSGFALGLLLVAKQTTLIALPLVPILADALRDRGIRARALAGGAALAVMLALPFIIGAPVDAWRALAVWQTIQPFRPVSLGFGPWIAGFLGGDVPFLVPALASGLLVLVALRRVAGTPAGFAWAFGAVSLLFFALSRQAFPSYYLACVGAFVAAIATARAADPTERQA